MNDIIDQAIEEANESAQVEEVSPKEPITDNVDQAQESGDLEPEQTEESGSEEEDVVFPKKAVNAIHRRDKKITKLQADYQKAIQELESIKRERETVVPERPNSDEYDSFDDYLIALVDWKSGASGVKPEQKNQTPQLSEAEVKQQVYQQQRVVAIDTRDAELSQKLHDYVQIKEANADILNSLSQDIVKVIFEADDAPAALYVLAKENKLEALAEMTPTRAAMELARAEGRSGQYLNRKITSAPAPISGARAKSNPHSKNLQSKTAQELLEWVKQ